MIHETAIVEPGAIVGTGTTIWHFVHVRQGAKVGCDCSLGKDVYVDTGAFIGNRVKIQNGVSVYAGVTLHDDVFIGPHAVFTNDLAPRANAAHWIVTPTLVKEGASIGANATILCGVTIGRWAMIGAGSVVTHDVPDYALVRGNPARAVGIVPDVQQVRCG